MGGHAFLDLFDGHAAVADTEQIVQDLLRRFQRYRASHKGGVGDDAVERTFKLTHVGCDFVGQEFQHLERNLGLQGFRFRLQDAQPQLVGGGVDIGHQPPA